MPSVIREKHDDGESALGDLVADSILSAGRSFGAQIAFMNNGGMRQDLESVPGPGAGQSVTLGHLLYVLPFGNTMVAMNLRGAQIRELLEQQWLGGRDITRGLLQVSEGFSYSWDPRRPIGSKVLADSVMLNGVPLENDSTYRVMVNNFLAEGGDGFPMFAQGRNRAETGVRDIDALSEYLRKREQAGKPAGRSEALGRFKRLQ